MTTVMPFPPTNDAPSFPLRRETGCCRDLRWRFDLPPQGDPGPVEACWTTAGYAARCRLPNLRVLRHGEGHELAWVPASGRVELRVPLHVERERRESAARALHAELLALLPPAVLPTTSLEERP
jgi:hypothetical protein